MRKQVLREKKTKFSMITVSSVVLVDGAQDTLLTLAEETAKI